MAKISFALMKQRIKQAFLNTGMPGEKVESILQRH
jgi:hypothetical protein